MESDGEGLSAADRTLATRLLEPDERALYAAPATATMAWAGIVSVAYAIPAAAIGWLPLRKALENRHALAGQAHGRLAFALFAGFGLIWIAIALRLVWEPVRLRRLWPHVLHLLTDRRMIAVDRRAGVLHEFRLAEIWQMKTFAPFGRISFYRTGFAERVGTRARERDFDGVRGVDALAGRIAALTGVPVGLGRAAAAHRTAADQRSVR